MTRRYSHACHHLRLKVVAYRRQMELDPEQLLAQVVEDGGNRRPGEDVGQSCGCGFCAASLHPRTR